ncbi:hypothetical protein KFE25_011672 [Diacronema lutheri]|uniref:EF-hand domain-containing protein n=1 Tax=Diacronema lutheri TaxID=2081491 RepID=A0A8J5X176_DIALT|nr:hypothetical protein KFE25_011672 [Diacronema lutheri]
MAQERGIAPDLPEPDSRGIVHVPQLLLYASGTAYTCTRVIIASNAGRTDRVAVSGSAVMLTLGVPGLLLLSARCARRGTTLHALLSGVLDVYDAVLVILLLSLVGSEVLVALEGENEAAERAACIAGNASLDALLDDLRARLSPAQLSKVAGALAYADCTFDNWSSFSLSPLFFTFTVMSTIGYGTSAPATQAGRLFTAFFALFSAAVAVVCLARIAARIEALTLGVLAWLMPPGAAIDEVFRDFDTDGSGTLQRAELMQLFTTLQEEGVLRADARDLTTLVAKMDADNDGDVSLDEFKRAIFGKGLDVRSFAITKYKAVVAIVLTAAMVLVASVVPPASGRQATWSGLDRFYFTMITLSTVGLGDLTWDTSTPGELVLFLVFAIVGLGLFATLISALSDVARTATMRCASMAREKRIRAMRALRLAAKLRKGAQHGAEPATAPAAHKRIAPSAAQPEPSEPVPSAGGAGGTGGGSRPGRPFAPLGEKGPLPLVARTAALYTAGLDGRVPAPRALPGPMHVGPCAFSPLAHYHRDPRYPSVNRGFGAAAGGSACVK